MARLLGPDANSRLVYAIVGGSLAANVGKTATIYSDAAGTVLADIATYDGTGTPGAVITGSTVTVDSTSQLPRFWFPAAGTDTLYAQVAGGPVTKINADYDARLDAFTGVNYRNTWAPSTAYAVNDLASLGGELLICKTAHTSGSTFSLTNWTNLTDRPGVFNVKLYGAKGDNTTDDTAAINAAVSAAFTWATVTTSTQYAEVYFPPAIYLLSGATTQGGATKGNAQIPLPVVPVANQKVTLVFRGVREATGLWHWQQTTAQKGGAVLRTTIVGTNDGTFGEASVIGGPTPAQGYGEVPNKLYSNMLLVIDGLEIVNTNNPTMCGVDVVGLGEANIVNLAVMADATPATVTLPTSGWQFGLRMPQNFNNAHSTIGSYSAEGQNFGVVIDEHTVANSIRCIYCVAAVEVGSSQSGLGHSVVIHMLLVESCNVAIGAVNGAFPAKIFVEMLDWEDAGSGSFSSFHAINDPNNSLFGRINLSAFRTIKFGSGDVNGAARVSIVDHARQAGLVDGGSPTMATLGVAYMNPFWRDAFVKFTGGTLTSIVVDGTNVGTTSPVMVPANRSITLNGSVLPTSWVWTLL